MCRYGRRCCGWGRISHRQPQTDTDRHRRWDVKHEDTKDDKDLFKVDFMRMMMKRNLVVAGMLMAVVGCGFWGQKAAGGGAGATESQAAAPGVVEKVDWAAFLGRQDLVWKKLPSKWEEGAFMGNGLLGANIYKTDDGKYVKFVMGRSDVVDKGSRI